VSVKGAGATGNLFSTITAYISATQVTLANNASTTVTGAYVTYGKSDSAAIQAACDAANASGGGRIILPIGKYYLSAAITVYANTSFLGFSPYASQLLNYSIAARGDNQIFADFTIDTRGTVSGGNFTYDSIGSRGSNKQFINLHVRNWTNKGIELIYDAAYGGGSKNCFISKCTIENPGNFPCGGGSVLVQGGFHNIHMIGNYFGSSTSNGNFVEIYGGLAALGEDDNYGLYFYRNKVKGPFAKAGYFWGRHVRIKDNEFYTDHEIASGGGAEESGGGPWVAKDFIYSGNTLYTNASAADSSILLISMGVLVNDTHQIDDVQIVDNHFEDGYIQIGNGTVYNDVINRLTIRRNHFKDANRSNIVLSYTSGSLTVNGFDIDDNIFNQWRKGSAGDYAAIQIAPTGTAGTGVTLTFNRASIKGNKFGAPRASYTKAIQISNVNGNGTIVGTFRTEGNDFTGCTVTETITGVLNYGDNIGLPGKRTGSTTSSATPTANVDLYNQYNVTALAADATLAAPTGTPGDGQILIYRIKDNGTARALSYNAIFRAVGVTLPATTVVSKTLYIGMKYCAADSRWDVVAVSQEA